jgi:hypothetical protein
MAKKNLTWAEQTTEDVLRPTPKVTAKGISYAGGQTASGYEPNLTAHPSGGIAPPQPTITVAPTQPVAVASPMPDTRVQDVNRLREAARTSGALVGEGLSGSINGQGFSAFATRRPSTAGKRDAFKAAITGTPAAPQGVSATPPVQDTSKPPASPDAQERAARVTAEMIAERINAGVKPKGQRSMSTAQRLGLSGNQPMSGYQKAQQRIGVPMTGISATQPARTVTKPVGMPLMGRGITPMPTRFDDSMA